jgi:hypothetical protein
MTLYLRLKPQAVQSPPSGLSTHPLTGDAYNCG